MASKIIMARKPKKDNKNNKRILVIAAIALALLVCASAYVLLAKGPDNGSPSGMATAAKEKSVVQVPENAAPRVENPPNCGNHLCDIDEFNSNCPEDC